MQLYCETVDNCRRKIFSDMFNSKASSFQPCKSKCDNCLLKYKGQQRRGTTSIIDTTNNKNKIKSSSTNKSMGFRKASEILKSKNNVAVPTIDLIEDHDVWLTTSKSKQPEKLKKTSPN